MRNYGYMVYDTLLAVDDKLQVKPQMLEGWKVSDDKLTLTPSPLARRPPVPRRQAGDRRGLRGLAQPLPAPKDEMDKQGKPASFAGKELKAGRRQIRPQCLKAEGKPLRPRKLEKLGTGCLAR